MEINHYNRDLHYYFKFGEHVYSNMQSKSNYLQFRIICYISNADEQKHISQVSAIDVYVQVKFKARIS